MTETPVRPIEWRLNRVMAERGIRFGAELRRRLVDVIGEEATPADTQITKLMRQPPARLPLRVLEGLCAVLDCEPGDLLTCGDRAGDPR